MSEGRKPLEVARPGLPACLLRPGLSDAERTFPALRNGQAAIAEDRSGGARPDRSVPDGDWPEAAMRMHADVIRVIEVVLQGSESILSHLEVLHPPVSPKIANRVDRMDHECGAVFETDVEGGTHRVRYCQVSRPGAAPADRRAYAEFSKAWRTACLTAVAANAVADHEQRGPTVDRGALAWCLGPADRIKVSMENSGKPQTRASATRAFLTHRELQLCK